MENKDSSVGTAKERKRKMITESTIYWVGILDRVQGLFAAMMIIHAVIGIVSFIVLSANIENCGTLKEKQSDKENYIKKHKQCTKCSIISVCLFAVLFTFTPSTKHACAIIMVPAISRSLEENKELQKLPDNVVNLANEWLETLKPEKK